MAAVIFSKHYSYSYIYIHHSYIYIYYYLYIYTIMCARSATSKHGIPILRIQRIHDAVEKLIQWFNRSAKNE